MTEQIYNPLDEIIKRIVENIQPDKIILFGSRSIGTAKNESDYDICVLKKDIQNKRSITHKIYRILLGVMASVDVIVETPNQFDELKTNPFLIYNQISNKGKVIYEK